MFRTVGRYAAVYLAWVASSLFGVYALLKSWEAIRQAYAFARPRSWAGGAVSSFTIVVLGIVWLVGVLYLEDYYRSARQPKLLPKRFRRVSLMEAAVVVTALVTLVLTA